MPVDFSFESTPNFRDLTQTGLVMLQPPVVRTFAQLKRLRQGKIVHVERLTRIARILAGTR